MTSIVQPRDEQDLAECVASAALARTPLLVAGGGSKADMGKPSRCTSSLSTSGLSGISHYQPAELVISVRPGTTLAELQRTLADNGQMLPFEPMDHRVLLRSIGTPTIGGITAANVSGPRRVAAGACRDSVIGVRFVNGRGEVIKSGGRVMKNVTGLDLAKLVCGSWGTLAVLSEITFKLLPRNDRSISVVLHGLDDEHAIRALSTALGSPFEISGAAHLPKGTVDEPETIVRVEGPSSSAKYRAQQVVRLWSQYGPAEIVGDDVSANLWQWVRDASFIASPFETAVWRLSMAPSKAPAAIARAKQKMELRHFYDWGGGLVWLATTASGDAGAVDLRTAMTGMGGHATLVRAPCQIRAEVDVFEPLSPPMRRLATGLKSSFDPHRILNTGRMHPGI